MGSIGQADQLLEEIAEDTVILPSIPSQDVSSEDPEIWDLVVVGAGVAGSALACVQGRQGRKVLLLERDLNQPDRIVGELLQPGGYLMLKRMGLEDCVKDIDSIKVYGYALFKDGGEAVVKYPVEGYSEDVAGRSFHHGRFVQRLRQAAKSEQSVTVRQGTVRRLINANGEAWKEDEAVCGVAYKTKDGQEHIAKSYLTIVCDGMFSTLRKNLSQPDIQHPSYFVGLLLKDTKLPHPNHGHVVLAKPSPILFYPISSTEVRCLVDVPGSKKLPSQTTGDLQKYLRNIVGPEVPEVLRAKFLEAIDNGRVRVMQNKQMAARPLHRPGALLLGDSFNMRHPLTGGGMTVALSDCNLLCETLKPLPDFRDAIRTGNKTSQFYISRKPLSSTINTLALALYKVFCYTGQKAHEEMRQACFEYLSLGGIYSSGPISLLSGLNPKPSVLVAHFFMVAVFGVGRLMYPYPTFGKLWLAILLLWGACQIIFPIILAEGVVPVFFPYFAKKPVLRSQQSRRRIERF
eukprot:TRINITY_DN1408_c0_g1_i1.p1 TRINITY_DN1408_c0_g1~~TRINITY_DN1408_c0_g1_i1.p1  ORF type:complete len:546 (-),score=66.46 TRINITY_DN1408_c0_g1_i1:926-2476(-)